MTTRNTQLHSLALAGILALGAAVAWFAMGNNVGNNIVWNWFPHPIDEQLIVLPDGAPVVFCGEADSQGPVCRGLDGRRVKAKREYDGSDRPRQAPISRLGPRNTRKNPFHGLDWGERLVQLSNYDRRMAWYFVHDGKLDGHGYFVGYDRKTGTRLGYIGRDGACADRPPTDQQFPVDGRRMVNRFNDRCWMDDRSDVFPSCNYASPDDVSPEEVSVQLKHDQLPPFTLPFLADDGLVLLNFKRQTAKYIRKDTDVTAAAIAILDAIEITLTPRPNARFRAGILLRTADRVRVVDMEGKEIQTYLLPAALRDCRLQWWCLPGDRVLIRPGRTEWNDELYWIDPKRDIARHENVTLEKHLALGRVKRDLILSLTAPSPASMAVVSACKPWARFYCSEAITYWGVLGSTLASGWSPWLVGGLSIGCAVSCYRRQRKYAMPCTGVWVAFVFLTGLPGYIGYLAHRRWPSRLPCPHCGRHVPRDRPACIACGREFPPPAMKGIEVLA
jgi:hypothetical protein